MNLSRRWAVAFVLALALFVPKAHAAAPRATHNVLWIMTDGLRWQEVFAGAEETLMSKENGDVKDVDGLKKAYWRDTPETRREALMPFVWSKIAKEGQLYGNQHKGSIARVTNGKNFSYPGYNETLCGFADPRIDSNDKKLNPNITVFEWLNRKEGYGGRVAAFGCWDVFPYIFNRPRCGFYVNAGYDPFDDGKLNPRLELLNQLKAENPRRWAAEPFDPITFHTAFEYLKERKPRLFYLSLNETDAWGHEGKYDEYLRAANRYDAYLKTIWDWAQSQPEYQGKTTLIISPDHGRGDAPIDWKSHGKDLERSQFIWMGFLGPDTPALGERSNIATVTQSQLAATLASIVGEDFCAAVAQAGQPIADVLGPKQQASR
jgi:hypothetical protein